jgi:hypothetical protein
VPIIWGVTVRAIVAVDVGNVPEVPVTVMVDVAAVAVAATVNVTTLVLVVGLVPITAVTPIGKPDTARVTLPLKGLMSVTVIVSVPVPPWTIESATGEAAIENPPVPRVVIVIVMVVVAVNVPEVPVMVIG